jgi:tRNA threonylcarbamoyladenosine modification (KEOPS) complex Cgi121 subunit
MIKVFGAQGYIQNIKSFLDKIQDFAKKYDIIIQVFNADMIYGKNHLISSIEHARRSMKRKTNTTNSLEMEILLYASGERQLKLAIPKMGIKKGQSNIAFIILFDNKREKDLVIDNLIDELAKLFSLNINNKILKGNISVLKRFCIDDNEIKTVMEDKYEDLILEKIAMVDIIK